MFTILMAFGVSLFLANKTIRQAVWTFIYNAWVWLVGAIVAVFVLATSLITSVYNMITDLGTKFGNMVLPSSSVTQSVSDYLAVANTIFPVAEGFAVLVALSVLWIAAMTYRLIKSWLPTLA